MTWLVGGAPLATWLPGDDFGQKELLHTGGEIVTIVIGIERVILLLEKMQV